MFYKISGHHWEFPHKTAIKLLKKTNKQTPVFYPLTLFHVYRNCLHVLCSVPERVWGGRQGWSGDTTQTWAIKCSDEKTKAIPRRPVIFWMTQVVSTNLWISPWCLNEGTERKKRIILLIGVTQKSTTKVTYW